MHTAVEAVSRAAPADPLRAAPPSRREVAGIALIVLAALLLRLHGLTTESVYLDEALSVKFAERPLRHLVFRNVDRVSPPLYYAFLNVWRRSFGVGEAAIRWPSALFGAAAVFVTWVLAREVTRDRLVPLTAAAALAVSGNHLYHSQEARMYALLVLATLASTWMLLQALRRGGAARWAAWVVLAAIPPLTHYQGYFVILGEVAGALLVALGPGRRPGLVRAVCLAAGALALALVPAVLLFLVGGPLQREAVDFWQGHLSWDDALVLFASWTVGAPWDGESAGVLRIAVIVATLVAALFPFVVVRRLRDSGPRSTGNLLLLGMLVTGAGGFLVLALLRNVWQTRYVDAFQPIYLLLIAELLLLVPAARPRLRMALAVLFVLSFLPYFVHKKLTLQRPDWRGIAHAMEARDPTGTSPILLYAPAYRRHALDYYLAQWGSARSLATVEDPVRLHEELRLRAAQHRGSFIVFDLTRPPRDWRDLRSRISSTPDARWRDTRHLLEVVEIRKR